ncbi:MAG TPA: hypothetical protein VGY13_06205 [Solirubrobacteraceae bacterium]|jgi:hypothetical protein|nr:hypothetical protein [Solirubrobacteraceae bacterium]
MLFDLRGRGRRRATRVIYGALAVLFGSGLVLFGVGGFGGTGILSSLSKEGGGGGPNYSAQISKYRKLTQKNPKDASAYENLVKNILHEAAGEEFVSATTGVVTSKGKQLYREASEAWQGYTALNPPKLNIELAQLMENIYSEAGLNEPAKEVEILQLAVAAKPNSASLTATLAEYAYKAHNTRVGDLASEKAVSLVAPGERKRLENELAEVKANPSGEKTYTTTTDGKTFTGKLNKEGKIEAHEVPTSSTSKSTTTKKK